MAKFNSNNVLKPRFNSKRYASRLWTPSERREIGLLYPMPSHGDSYSGWSQVSTHPQRLFDDAQARMADHLINGCNAQLVPGGRINEDGSQARSCSGCGGRWKGTTDIDARTASLFGIRQDSSGRLHHEGDSCEMPHRGTSWVRNAPSMADYAMLPIQIPGVRGNLTVADLLANAHSTPIGKTKSLETIYPGRIENQSTGSVFHANPIVEVSHHVSGNKQGMRRLVESGVEDPNDYFDIARDTAHDAFSVKHKELKTEGAEPESYAGLVEGAPHAPSLQIITDGVLRNIRRTLGDQGLDLGRIHPVDHARAQRLWDMMGTARTTLNLSPHYAFDEHANPLNAVVDVQHHIEAATSKRPGVQAAYFAGFPGYLPSIKRSMSELGSVAKRATDSVFWGSPDHLENYIHRLVRNHKDGMDLRNPISEPISVLTDTRPIDLEFLRRSTEGMEEPK